MWHVCMLKFVICDVGDTSESHTCWWISLHDRCACLVIQVHTILFLVCLRQEIVDTKIQNYQVRSFVAWNYEFRDFWNSTTRGTCNAIMKVIVQLIKNISKIYQHRVRIVLYPVYIHCEIQMYSAASLVLNLKTNMCKRCSSKFLWTTLFQLISIKPFTTTLTFLQNKKQDSFLYHEIFNSAYDKCPLFVCWYARSFGTKCGLQVQQCAI